jgi:DNA polymerase elongation subunit (family B)
MIQAVQKGSILSISYFNENGSIAVRNVPIEQTDKFVWEETDNAALKSEYTSQTGVPVRKVRKDYLNKYRRLELIQQLPENIQEEIFRPCSPKKWFWDIETEVTNGEFPDASNPVGKILLHTICNTDGRGIVFGLKELSEAQVKSIETQINEHLSRVTDKTLVKKVKIEYRYYKDEYSMNYDFLVNYFSRFPIVLGWNVIMFDAQYFLQRCRRLGIRWEDYASPIKACWTCMISDKYNKDQKYSVDLPVHRPIIDYMKIFEFFDQSVAQKESMSLGFISQAVLGVTKVEYQGDLQQLYEKDYARFVFYGMVDAFLVELIDAKTDILSLAIQLTSTGRVELHSCTAVSAIIENIMLRYYRENYNQILIKHENTGDKSSYDGAFVVEPPAGLYNGAVIMDFESLYPSIMQFLNAGYDTYIGQLVPLKDGETVQMVQTPKREMIPYDPETMVRSYVGVVYDKTRPSAIRVLIDSWFNERVQAKHVSSDIKHEIAELNRLLDEA